MLGRLERWRFRRLPSIYGGRPAAALEPLCVARVANNAPSLALRGSADRGVRLPSIREWLPMSGIRRVDPGKRRRPLSHASRFAGRRTTLVPRRVNALPAARPCRGRHPLCFAWKASRPRSNGCTSPISGLSSPASIRRASSASVGLWARRRRRRSVPPTAGPPRAGEPRRRAHPPRLSATAGARQLPGLAGQMAPCSSGC